MSRRFPSGAGDGNAWPGRPPARSSPPSSPHVCQRPLSTTPIGLPTPLRRINASWRPEPTRSLPASQLGNQANSLASRERYEEAEASYRKAIQFGPQRGSHYYNFARLLQQRKRAAEALQVLTEGLRMARQDQHTALLCEDIALLYAEREDGERSLEAAERAVGLAPDRVRANYFRGRALALQGRLHEGMRSDAAGP